MWAALAGGVGGAKLARGLAAIAPNEIDELRVIINTGDDFALHGLQIAPDVDTVLYTLAGIANPTTGWGIADDTASAQAQLARMGVDTWFWLGDRDLATHIMRTHWLASGFTLTEVTERLARSLGIAPHITLLPMTDAPVATEVQTPAGWLAFQDYFVRRHHADPVRAVRFAGISRALPTTATVTALRAAEVVVFCPSNPIVSIGPILTLRGVRQAIEHREAEAHPRCCVAVSPIIGGRALKGPADVMLASMGFESSAVGVARLYEGLVDIFVLDESDAHLAPQIADLGMRPLVAPIIMTTPEESRTLARRIHRAVAV
ncbi:MAG: 2-phospho-L-lactate transferase [Ktedonobacterales bacterium]|nr:2-phospho-L-lactate transferase [Ktedonobacterales bacterium]